MLKQKMIAMLAVNKRPSKFKYALACTAHINHMNFYYFTYDSIDYHNKKIEGYCYDNGEWVKKKFDYPDYIYDRLLKRGREKYKECYQELEMIPFSNGKTPSGPINKFRTYNFMKKGEATSRFLIPYKRVEEIETIFEFLDRYQKIICKIGQGSLGYNVLFISKVADGYLVKEQSKEAIYAEADFLQYVEEKILNSTPKYIVQSYIESTTSAGNPFDLRTHLMKNRQGKWDIVKIYPRIGVRESKISNMHFGGSTCDINMFLRKHVDLKDPKVFYNNLVKEAVNFATEFEKNFKFHFSEMALDVGVDKNEKLYIFEVNMNQISNLYFEFEIADAIVNYAQYYLNLNHITEQKSI